MPRTGNLRERVAFREELNTPDGGGGNTLSWVTRFTVWGRLKPVTAREQLRTGRLEASADYVLTVRQSSDTETVEENWSVLLGEIEYNIKSILNPDERGRFLEMIVTRGAAV